MTIDEASVFFNKIPKIKAIPISNSWLELDSYNDFVVYKNMHEKNTLSKFFNISN